jgi:hypothetical protein
MKSATLFILAALLSLLLTAPFAHSQSITISATTPQVDAGHVMFSCITDMSGTPAGNYPFVEADCYIHDIVQGQDFTKTSLGQIGGPTVITSYTLTPLAPGVDYYSAGVHLLFFYQHSVHEAGIPCLDQDGVGIDPYIVDKYAFSGNAPVAGSSSSVLSGQPPLPDPQFYCNTLNGPWAREGITYFNWRQLGTTKSDVVPTMRISPNPAPSVGAGETIPFTTNESSRGISIQWSVVPNDPTKAGTIDGNGLYKAPNPVVTGFETVTIVATNPQNAGDTDSVIVGLKQLAVSIDPTSAVLNQGQTASFTLSDGNNNPTNATWTADLGKITSPGATATYTAPDSVLSQATALVTGTSTLDTTKSAIATVVLRPVNISIGTLPISISPPTNLTINSSLSGNVPAPPAACAWDPVTTGSLVNTSCSGATYILPTNITVPQAVQFRVCDTATKPPTCSSQASTYILPPLTITGTSGTWNSGQTNNNITITGTGFGSSPTVTIANDPCHSSNVPCITFAQSSTATQITLSNVTIPVEYAPISLTLVVTNTTFAVGQTSGSISVTTVPARLALSVSPGSASLDEFQAQTFQVGITCATPSGFSCDAPQGVSWQTVGGQPFFSTLGSFNGNTFQVQATGVAAVTPVVAKACAQVNPQVCSSLITINIQPIKISVSPATAPSLTSGKAQQFSANVANPPYNGGAPNTAVSWSVRGSGSINSTTGLYSAPDTVTANETVTIVACSTGDSTAALCATAKQPLMVIPDFQILIGAPSKDHLSPSSSVTYPITLRSVSGFAGNVTLSATGLPPGLTASFNPTPVIVPANGSGSSTLTITSSSSPTFGDFTISINSTASGAGNHLNQIPLTVAPPSFTISVANSQTVTAGKSTGPVPVKVSPTDGFNGTVSLTLTSANGQSVPAGITYVFSPATVAGGSGTPTLTITAADTVPAGAYGLLVGGTGGNQTKSAPLVLTVVIPDFTISAVTNPPGTLPGHSTSTQVKVTPINGFTGAVVLGSANLPPGATASFSPPSITGGSGISVMTINVPSTAGSGFYNTVTVTGTSGSLVHSDTMSLEVGLAAGDNDPTLGVTLALPNNTSITLYGGDTFDFDSLPPGVFPYPQTALFKVKQTGGLAIGLFSVNSPGPGLEEVKNVVSQTPADGSSNSSFSLLIHPTSPVAYDLRINYYYVSDHSLHSFTSTIHLKAGSLNTFTNDPSILFHVQDEYGTRLPIGAVNPDGSESPVTDSFSLGTYGINNTHFGITRFLNVCNDSTGPISVVRFWDDEPDATQSIFTDNIIGATVLRNLVQGQCGQVAVFGENDSVRGTFTGSPKIFVTKYPEPPRLDSGTIQWLPLAFTKVNRTIPGLALSANNDQAFFGYRGEVDMFRGPRNRPFGRTYTLTNSTQVPLTVSGLKVTNVTGTSFSLLRNFTRTTLTPGQTATFQVRFWPKAAGPFAGYVDFTTNSVDTNYRFLLQGTVGAAANSSLQVMQGGVEIYNGGSFDTTGPLLFTLTNNGAAPLQFADLSMPANYQINSGLPATLDVGARADIQFTKISASNPQTPGAIMFSTGDPDDLAFEMDESVGPVLQDDYATTPANVPVTINVTANDVVQDGPVTLTASPITAAPAHGTAVRLSDSEVVYTPSQDFTGADSFTYQAVTPAGNSSTAFVYITVGAPAVDSLVAVDDQATADNGGAVDINVLANDRVMAGKTMTISNPTVITPIFGTVQVMAPGILRYLPTFNTVAEDSFMYEITDGVATARAMVHIHLTQSIPPPVAVSDSVSTPPNTAVVISPLANDLDPYGGGLALPGNAIVTAPLNGIAVVQGLSQIVYTPNPGFVGSDFFQYQCTNGHGGFSTAWIGVNVAVPPPPNYPPVAAPDSAITYINQAVIIPVTANDSDPDGDTISLMAIATPPHAGTATIVDPGNIRYTPTPYSGGTDTFVYQIQDGHGHTALGQVTVNVMNHPPVATPDFAQTNSSTAININVVANDTDAEQDPISLTSTPVVTPPASGTVTFVDSNTLNYKPKFGFVGNDVFTYQIKDLRGAIATGTVTVTVVNRPPVAVDDAVSTPFNTPVTINVLQNDSDPDGHTLALSSTPVVSGPAVGAKVTVSGNSLIYTPAPGFTGSDSFQYEMQDLYGARARATVSVSIINRPPVAVSDTFTVIGSNPTQLAVLANDSDPDGEAISLVNNFVNPLHGTIAIDSYKFVDYTATACFVGADSLKYYVQDSRGAMTQGSVTVNVVSDHIPVAVTDNVSTPSGTFTTINVTANDCHPDNQRPYLDVNFPLYVAPAHGNIQLLDNTTFYYTSFSGYHGTDTFQYNLRDAAGHYVVGTVNITIL